MNILVTAGPTRAMIDPVRFISNLSTGHMGYEIAREAHRQKHKTTLISGPTLHKSPRGVRMVQIISVGDLERAVMREVRKADVLIMTAAVSDYVPIQVSRLKIKRKKNIFNLTLKKTPDIVARVGHLRRRPILVGFSLETDHLKAYTWRKLKQKNLDVVVGNFYSKKHSPFGDKKSSVLIMNRSGRSYWFKNKTKRQIARRVLTETISIFNET